MAKPVKGGYLLRHKKRLFGSSWREEWVVLYEDSTLAWYKEKGKGDPEGNVVVKEAPEMLAVSQWTLRVPGRRPLLPIGCQVEQLMAFGTRRGEKVHWLLAQSEEEVNDWMTAISNTLPPPPQPPDEFVSRKHVNSNDQRLPFDPIQPSESYHQIYTPQLITPDSNQLHQTLYHEQAVPSPVDTDSTCLLVQNNRDLNTELIIAPAIANWGHGLGWGCTENPYSFSTFMHDLDVNLDISSHVDSYNGCDDADFGMDCSGDFGF